MSHHGDTQLHPLIALRSLIEVAQDPEKTEVGAAMVKALEGRSRERLMGRFASDPMGAQILAEGRRIERTLSDSAVMDAFETGSLGECYKTWTRAEGTSAEGLIAGAGYVDFQASPERQLRSRSRSSTTRHRRERRSRCARHF